MNIAKATCGKKDTYGSPASDTANVAENDAMATVKDVWNPITLEIKEDAPNAFSKYLRTLLASPSQDVPVTRGNA